MLKQRIITGIVLIAIVIAAIFYLPPIAFAILTLIPLIGAAIEWTTLMNIKRRSVKIIYCASVVVVAAGAYLIPITSFIFALAWWIVASIWLLAYPRGTSLWCNHRLLTGIIGLLVLVPCWTAVNYIKEVGDGAINLLLLLAIVWSVDIGAYFTGRRFGTRRMAPLISPNKTVEGFYGGIITSIIVFLGLGLLIDSSLLSSLFFATIMLLTALLAVVGDLFESMIKRMQNKKDSGSLLPGHGGILDRIDSLTAAAPCFAFGVWILQLGWQ